MPAGNRGQTGEASAGPFRATRPGYALVLSGGGIRFATHVGVVAEMDSWNMSGRSTHRWLDQFKVLVGTSAGALYAGLYAGGYEPQEIVTLAELLSGGDIGQRLFDKNIPGAAAAYLRYDPALFLGFVRGESILSLLETLFHKASRDVIRQELARITPESPVRERRVALRRILDLWQTQKADQREQLTYYREQVTFADVRQGCSLYLIATHALTGQKTVFCRVSASRDANQRADDAAAAVIGRDSADPRVDPRYLNLRSEVDALVADTLRTLSNRGRTFRLDPRRWDHRAYWQFDDAVYGQQLPLALAVRASLSIPVVFNPVVIRRRSDGAQGPSKDVFIDGGVADNLSLSVAAAPEFGSSAQLLGVGLSNFGYRLPGPKAISRIDALLQSSIGYMADAVADFEVLSQDLLGKRVTVIDALPYSLAQLTETQRVPELIREGRAIAADFLRAAQERPRGADPDRSGVDESKIFLAPLKVRVYLSTAAVVGTPDLGEVREPDTVDPDPELGRAFLPFPWPHWWMFVVPVVALAGLGVLLQASLDAAKVLLGCPATAFDPASAAIDYVPLGVALLLLPPAVRAFLLWPLGAESQKWIGVVSVTVVLVGLGVLGFGAVAFAEVAFGCPPDDYDPTTMAFSALIAGAVGLMFVRIAAFVFAKLRRDPAEIGPWLAGIAERLAEPEGRWRAVLTSPWMVALAIATVAAFLIFIRLVPGAEVVQYAPSGKLLDETLGYTPTQVYAAFNEYGPSGRAAYSGFIAFDLVFAATYGIGLAFVGGRALPTAREWRLFPVWTPVLLPVLLAGADWTEDVLLWVALSAFPERLDGWLIVATWATTTKWVLLGSFILLLLAVVFTKIGLRARNAPAG